MTPVVATLWVVAIASLAAAAAAFDPLPPHAPAARPTVLVEVGSRLRQRTKAAAPDAAAAAATNAPAVDAGTDQLRSAVPFYDTVGAAPHAITLDERTYTPEGQLDAAADEQARVRQAAELDRFNARLDTQVLVRQAAKLTARARAVAARHAAAARFVARDGAGGGASEQLTPLTSASTANLERTQQQRQQRPQRPSLMQEGKRDWLEGMRFASARARSEQAAANAIETVARQAQRNRALARHGTRHRHRHRHALNLGQRVAQHNRAAGRTRVASGAGARVRDDDGGGDVEDEKYLATDEAKGQEAEYEPDESSNNWWWDYWAPYIA